jgi:hypothetical protein
MDNCNRCNVESDELVALSRYVETSIATEMVCPGCCTTTEHALGEHIDNDPWLLAFVLAATDGIYACALATGATSTLIPPTFLKPTER